MASPLRSRSIALPQCTACLRSYAWQATADASACQNALRQQTRSKKTATKASATVPARLLKDLPGFGKAVTRGELRNHWFPKRIAAYVTLAEQRQLRRDNIPIERDYNFGKKDDLAAAALAKAARAPEPEPAPVYEKKAPEVERLTAQRSMELLDIFVPHRIDFYREPIMEAEKLEEPEAAAAAEKKEDKKQSASSAAADLLAARSSIPREKPKPKMTGAIYGSVSAHDILVAVRAAIATNDEAARVLIAEQDIHFMDPQAQSENKIKSIGDFTIELKIKGVEQGIRRTVRVVPQESS
ncbi:uncharacterized protein MYCFIDRAFT_35247 [Pseudocercospora fijiensis CIRAD86]|uniref:Ribosomal protein L9 domain-containing protein n=1 Tax=Pseudocercospora fijiensis (strain CIRAD86) TaxID=383855 RepID=N1Q7L1_PSEFD|nr:uncharacterized protein MYCFIDRAFT_35247 [Pseudocercospora fijiensis CIRAD86]EME88689.1 hypothetical protein MYCFIDRAFT_35247 [Pseudocercospora fijiensis CIRAD86]